MLRFSKKGCIQISKRTEQNTLLIIFFFTNILPFFFVIREGERSRWKSNHRPFNISSQHISLVLPQGDNKHTTLIFLHLLLPGRLALTLTVISLQILIYENLYIYIYICIFDILFYIWYFTLIYNLILKI